MAYEETSVAVSKSQEQIKKLVYAHKGAGVMLISRPPHEGFEAFIALGNDSYHIRVMAQCRDVSKDNHGWTRSAGKFAAAKEQEERRVWRVLYWHLKAMFEAADSGVIDLRDIIMPYVVLKDGMTVADIVKPRMKELMTMSSARLLGDGN